MIAARFLFVSCFLVILQISASAQSLTLTNIGNPPVAGSAATVSGGFDLIASGSDIGGTNDQFAFYYQSVSGDFDLRVRVEALGAPDPFAKAGLVVRDAFAGNSRFVAVLTTPSVAGSLFAWRATNNAAATNTGSFPVNYPNTWLRLQRISNQFI